MSPALYRSVKGVLVPVIQVAGGNPDPATGYAARDALDGTEGSYKPTTSNTGAIAGVELTEWGMVDQTITVTGSQSLTLRDKILRVDIDWRSTGVLDVRNCLQVGWNKNWTSASAWIRTDSNPGTRNVNVVDTTIKPLFPTPYANGQIGPDIMFKRVLMEDVTDGFGLRRPSNWNSDVRARILSCMVHRLSWFTPDTPNNRPNTHNDCIQVFAGFGMDIIGNTLLGTISDTSGTPPFGRGTGSGTNTLFPAGGRPITITPTVNVPINLNLLQNWLDYGASGDIAFTLGNDSTGTTGNSSNIKGNRHGRNQPSQTQDGITARRPLKIDNRLTIPGFTTADNAAVQDTTNGNVYEDNGSPITYYTGAF